MTSKYNDLKGKEKGQTSGFFFLFLILFFVIIIRYDGVFEEVAKETVFFFLPDFRGESYGILIQPHTHTHIKAIIQFLLERNNPPPKKN